jgi:hypothetical protein
MVTRTVIKEFRAEGFDDFSRRSTVVVPVGAILRCRPIPTEFAPDTPPSAAAEGYEFDQDGKRCSTTWRISKPIQSPSIAQDRQAFYLNDTLPAESSANTFRSVESFSKCQKIILKSRSKLSPLISNISGTPPPRVTQ